MSVAVVRPGHSRRSVDDLSTSLHGRCCAALADAAPELTRGSEHPDNERLERLLAFVRLDACAHPRCQLRPRTDFLAPPHEADAARAILDSC